MTDQNTTTIVIKTGLDELKLAEYLAEQQITREQVINVTESEKGKFTLIFEGTAEQYATYRDELEQRIESRRAISQAFRRRGPEPYYMGGRH